METYVVRIYRREKNIPRLVLGVVEHVGGTGKRGFTSFEELRELLELADDTVTMNAKAGRA